MFLIQTFFAAARINLVDVLSDLLDTSQPASPAGSDETNLASGGSLLGDSGGHTDVLVVTSSVGVLDGVHGNTTDPGPLVALDAVLVEGAAGLKEGLVSAAPAGDDTDLGAGGGGDGLLAARGEANAGGALVEVMGNDDGIITGGTRELAAVAEAGLDVAADGSLRNNGQGEDISNVEGGLVMDELERLLKTENWYQRRSHLLSAVDELASVHALSGNEELVVLLVLVGVGELDLGDGGTASGVVNDVLDDAADVAVLLGVVKGAELHSALPGSHMRLENPSLSLTASSDNLSHVGLSGIYLTVRTKFVWMECERAVCVRWRV